MNKEALETETDMLEALFTERPDLKKAMEEGGSLPEDLMRELLRDLEEEMLNPSVKGMRDAGKREAAKEFLAEKYPQLRELPEKKPEWGELEDFLE